VRGERGLALTMQASLWTIKNNFKSKFDNFYIILYDTPNVLKNIICTIIHTAYYYFIYMTKNEKNEMCVINDVTKI